MRKTLSRTYVWGTALIVVVAFALWWPIQSWYRAQLLGEARVWVEVRASVLKVTLEEILHEHLRRLALHVSGPGLVVQGIRGEDGSDTRGSGRLFLYAARYHDEQLLVHAQTPFDLRAFLKAYEREYGFAMMVRDVQHRVLYGVPEILGQGPVVLDVEVPDGPWMLAAIPEKGWEAVIAGRLGIFRALSLLSIGALAAAVWANLRHAYWKRIRDEAKAWALLNAPSDAALLIDPNSNIIAANTAAARGFGVELDEFIGHNLREFSPPDVGARRREWLRLAVSTKQPVRFQDERAGRFFDSTFYPILDVDGQVRQIAVYARDITAQRRAEEARRQSAQTAQAILDAIPDVALLMKPDSTIIAMNRAAEQSLQVEAARAIGMKAADLLPPEVAELYLSMADQVVRTGKPLRFTDERNGRWFEHNVYPIPEDGPVQQLAVIAREITGIVRALEALSESEARARALFENIGDTFVLLDENLTVVEFRDSVDRPLGVTPEHVLGQPFAQAFERSSLYREGTAVDDLLRAVLRDGHTRRLSDVEWYPLASDDKSYLDVVVYRIGDGERARVAVLMRDATDRHRLQEILRRRERLETLGEFSAFVAHDFGNVLSTIRAACSLLDEDIGRDHPNRPDVDAIIEAADQGARMVHHLVAYCRGEPPAFDLLDMATWLWQNIALIRRQLGEGIALTVHIEDAPLIFE
ncbi:MAG: PAS domain-containing protein, partial [Chloroflexi bacterium]|nr:PAS domain-containing protein [Chloroflexota bacterium]